LRWTTILVAILVLSASYACSATYKIENNRLYLNIHGHSKYRVYEDFQLLASGETTDKIVIINLTSYAGTHEVKVYLDTCGKKYLFNHTVEQEGGLEVEYPSKIILYSHPTRSSISVRNTANRNIYFRVSCAGCRLNMYKPYLRPNETEKVEFFVDKTTSLPYIKLYISNMTPIRISIEKPLLDTRIVNAIVDVNENLMTINLTVMNNGTEKDVTIFAELSNLEGGKIVRYQTTLKPGLNNLMLEIERDPDDMLTKLYMDYLCAQELCSDVYTDLPPIEWYLSPERTIQKTASLGVIYQLAKVIKAWI